MYESGGIFDPCGIGGRVGTVKCEVEFEIRKFFLKLEKIVQIEHLVESTCPVEIVHLAVGGL